MKVTYALEPHAKSIFLAGPTPRSPLVPSWRPEALRILERLNFQGEVIVPEAADWSPHDDYDHQVRWEWEGISRATVVAFWVPRDLETMPAFTTNVEFGLVVASGRAVLGAPADAAKLTYLRHLAHRLCVPQAGTLEGCMRVAMSLCADPYPLPNP